MPENEQAIDFMTIVDDFDVSGLTKKKITNKFVKEHFDVSPREIQVEKVVKDIPVQEIFMGNKLPLSIYLGILEQKFNVAENAYIQTMKVPNAGIVFRISELEFIEVSEKQMIDGIKTALKKRLDGPVVPKE